MQGKANDGTTKEKLETTIVQIENRPEEEDAYSSQIVLEHDVQELVQSKAYEVQRSTHERRPSTWHSEYVIEINIAYCLLIEDGEQSTFHEATKSPYASLWMTAM